MELFLRILKQYWGYDSFRALQPEIMESIAAGNDTLGLMPTGGGKSLTFQVPALASEGICLVVTPLIALMKDQVRNLQQKGIKAVAIHSGMTLDEINVTLDNCIYGNFKFLYLSPERMATEAFLQKLPLLKVNILTIDEAHCISQWGYDFRPSYLKVAEIRNLLPGVPVLALTATATPSVVTDIMEKLRFRKPNVFSKSFLRNNLAYVVREAENKEQQLVHILRKVPGCGIVYVRNRKKTREFAELLVHNGISAAWFHAGLQPADKDRLQEAWTRNEIRIMVCTNAFGMGIDKPDVRVVVHMDAPDSLEAYFQEAGRAGRDGQKAYAILLWSNHDADKLQKSIVQNFPEPEEIKRIYEALGNFFQIAEGSGMGMNCDFQMGAFCKAFHFSIIQVYSSLKILERAGYLEFAEELEMGSRLIVLADRNELYRVQVANADLDAFIKVLLRSYTGLFTEYVAIDEEELAKRNRLTRQEVYDLLLRLARMRVVKYNPRKKSPVISWSQNREAIRYVELPKAIYLDRKLDYITRVQSVIQYGSVGYLCRSKQLLHYFGEKNSAPCGQCDVCLKKNKLAQSATHFDEVMNVIETLLRQHPLPHDELLLKLKYSPEQIDSVLRWLEDYHLVSMTENGLYEWN